MAQEEVLGAGVVLYPSNEKPISFDIGVGMTESGSAALLSFNPVLLTGALSAGVSGAEREQFNPFR